MADNQEIAVPVQTTGADYQVVLMLGRLEAEVKGVRLLLENYNARMDRQDEAHNFLAVKQSDDVRKLWDAHRDTTKELTQKIHETDKKQTWFAAAAAVGVGVIVWMIDHLPFISGLNKVN